MSTYSFTEYEGLFQQGKAKSCLLDTSYLLKVLDEEEKYHNECLDFHRKLVDSDTKLWIAITTKTEFLDKMMRKLLGKALNAWVKLDEEKLPQKLVLKIKSSRGRGRISDSIIKDIRKLVTDSKDDLGQDWFALCNAALSNKLNVTWKQTVESLSLNYLERNTNKDGSKPYFNPKWDNMVLLMEKTALAASDALTANALDESHIDALITTDYDFAFAAKCLKADKIVFLPEPMHRKLSAYLMGKI